MKKRYTLIGYNKFEDREHLLMKFDTFYEFKDEVTKDDFNVDELEGYTNYTIRDYLTNTFFEILEISNYRMFDVNIVSKLKKTVRGYFSYDKTR